MRPVPDFLPSANSRKWHNRRVWDPLGYIRVRTLANPTWQRDDRWLARVLDLSRPKQPGEERHQYDLAVASLRVYGSARPRGAETASEWQDRSEQLWDDFLGCLDGYLRMVHDRHIRSVDEAGVSGR